MTGLIMWSPGVTLEAVEKQVILEAFKHYRGNKSATAVALGISVRTLDNKFERYDSDQKAEELSLEKDRLERAHHLARARGQTPEFNNAPAIRYGVESAAHPTAQHALSLPQREEVQAVLSAKSGAHGARKGR